MHYSGDNFWDPQLGNIEVGKLSLQFDVISSTCFVPSERPSTDDDLRHSSLEPFDLNLIGKYIVKLYAKKVLDLLKTN